MRHRSPQPRTRLKCVKKNNEDLVKRIDYLDAIPLVHIEETWHYVPKSVWRAWKRIHVTDQA